MESLSEYARTSTEDVKAAVRKAGNTVRDEIKGTAPKDTGAYAKSWSVKTEKETSASLEIVVVHSRNRYQLAHPFGIRTRQARRRQGSAKPHMRPAEQKGV